ncbi:MAG: acyl-ACP--UDP-N-acetylglucosamine O-acyltransferase [Candidatus Cloacimonetes bacterium]|nr:acyl-ACP--UDP-N-acetylglucosamine O-acyltransferase [Candidatus Cloacimonadota bacterium]
MIEIHPTAIVSPQATVGEGCIIGAWCTIGDNVVLGERNIVRSHVIIDGHTFIGDDNRIFHHAVIGTEPQDLKFKGEPTRLRIGSHNTIREFATINRSNQMDEDTNVGDYNLIMEYVHIAHNCQIGSHCVIANIVQLAGHVHLHDWVTMGGASAVHQFVKIGSHAFVGGGSAVKMDIAPYTRGEGNPYKTSGLNSVGLMRKGFSNESLAAIKAIYNHFYRNGMNVTQAITAIGILGKLTPEQQVFLDFVNNCDRGLSS